MSQQSERRNATSNLFPKVKRIIVRIVNALEEPDQTSRIVTAADRYMNGAEHTPASRDTDLRLYTEYPPSERAACDASMPFFPESSNPEKVFEPSDWKIYLVDLVTRCLWIVGAEDPDVSFSPGSMHLRSPLGR